MCWKTEEVFICQNGVLIMNRVTMRILNEMDSVLIVGNMFTTGMTVNIAERKKSNRKIIGKFLFFDLCSKVFDINETMEMWRKVWYNRINE